MLAPICFFTYNRLEETKQTIDALKKNFLASESHLYIFSDGPKSYKERHSVDEVRNYLESISGFKSVSINKTKKNKGLANSIISGVSKIINKYGKAIVVEDDLILSDNFLTFMNNALDFYENNNTIFSISGYSVKFKIPKKYLYDAYFWARPHSWGWATWKDRWSTIDWEVKDYEQFKTNRNLKRSFNKLGSDLSKMLISSMNGKIDSWLIRFTYNQFMQKKITVYPVFSKVINNGFNKEATHCNVYNRFTVTFDKTSNKNFKFSDKIVINKKIGKQVYKYHSLKTRIIYKIYTYLLRLGLIKQNIQSY